jgi:hypothetical protein
MANREVHILSYFSLPTDLAATFSNWPEFRSGADYVVDFAALEEAVEVRLVESTEGQPYVTVVGSGDGRLFEQVLGAVLYALGKNSDNLMVDRVA